MEVGKDQTDYDKALDNHETWINEFAHLMNELKFQEIQDIRTPEEKHRWTEQQKRKAKEKRKQKRKTKNATLPTFPESGTKA